MTKCHARSSRYIKCQISFNSVSEILRSLLWILNDAKQFPFERTVWPYWPALQQGMGPYIQHFQTHIRNTQNTKYVIKPAALISSSLGHKEQRKLGRDPSCAPHRAQFRSHSNAL